jgi:hypothetical protein
VTFEEFDGQAWQEWERIPEEYRSGVDGLVIERAASPHPSLPDVYTLGECVTESYPSAFGDADSIRSVVVLYYGSFFRLSRLDPEFDWAGELWETLTHELQHHLESLADDDRLGGMDYAADQNYRRYQGESFDPFFFRQGMPEGDWLRVEDEYFLEVQPSGAHVEFEWAGARYGCELPAVSADVTLATVVAGVADAPEALHLVVVRPSQSEGLLDVLRGLFRPRRAHVAVVDVEATPL